MAIESTPGPGTRILIVDDEDDIRLSLKALFEASIDGLDVDTAESGEAALELLKDHTFSLIVSDYLMDGMDGITFLEHVRKSHPETPTIMITAHPDAQLAAQAVYKVGVGLFIAKPFNLDYLVDVVRSVLDGRHEHARNQGGVHAPDVAAHLSPKEVPPA